MKRTTVCKGLILAALLLGPQAQAQVVVSFQPIYDLTARVARGGMSVERIANVGASPHHYDPTARDLVRIRGAKVAVMAGLGADSWLERYTVGSASKARVVKLGEQMTFNRLRSGNSVDPHWWLDASLMAKAASVVANELGRADPANAGRYRANAAAEARRLNALHSELKRTLKPVQGRKLVTFHNAFGYFARAYSLQVVATLTPPAGTDPTPVQMRQAVQVVRQHRLPAIFAEPQLPDRAAQAVARETGVNVFILDPEGSRGRTDYAVMMRYNRDTLLKAFR